MTDLFLLLHLFHQNASLLIFTSLILKPKYNLDFSEFSFIIADKKIRTKLLLLVEKVRSFRLIVLSLMRLDVGLRYNTFSTYVIVSHSKQFSL
jgi:hypothetical protein